MGYEKDARVTIRLSSELREFLETKAREHKVTISEYMRIVMERERRNG